MPYPCHAKSLHFPLYVGIVGTMKVNPWFHNRLSRSAINKALNYIQYHMKLGKCLIKHTFYYGVITPQTVESTACFIFLFRLLNLIQF